MYKILKIIKRLIPQSLRQTLKRSDALVHLYKKNVVHSVWGKVVTQDSDFISAYQAAADVWCQQHTHLFKVPEKLVVCVFVESDSVVKLDITDLNISEISQVILIADNKNTALTLEQLFKKQSLALSIEVSIYERTQLSQLSTTLHAASPFWFAILKPGERIIKESLDYVESNYDYTSERTVAAIYFDHYDSESRKSIKIKPSFDPLYLNQRDYIDRAVWLNAECNDFVSTLEHCRKHNSITSLLNSGNNIVHSRPIPGFELEQPVSSYLGNNATLDNETSLSSENCQPLVSIIIPTKDQVTLLEKAVESVLTTKYPNVEILIVDNQSTDDSTLRYMKTLSEQGIAKIIQYDKPFNYSAMNNVAVEQSSGELMCFLNNDIEAISDDWLPKLLIQAVKPNVGAVGAKLLYPDNTIQHAGVVVGLNGIADHVFKGVQQETVTNINELNSTRNVTAVTGACLLVKRQAFDNVGGFNHRDLAVAFNDIDLCLKLAKSGLQNVWIHDAVLFHHESVSRGFDGSETKRARFESEVNYMKLTWKIDCGYTDPCANQTWSRAIDMMRGK